MQKNTSRTLNSLKTQVIPKKFGKQLIQLQVDHKRTLFSMKLIINNQDEIADFIN